MDLQLDFDYRLNSERLMESHRMLVIVTFCPVKRYEILRCAQDKFCRVKRDRI